MVSTIRRVRHVALAALIMLPAAGPAAGQANGSSVRSTLAGAYSLEQAESGAVIFSATCASCHPTSQFTGIVFQRAWSGRPIFALFDQLRLMMPMDNPGGLSNEEYAAVIAYILKLNGYPSAEAPLPSDDAALKQVIFEPLPDPAG